MKERIKQWMIDGLERALKRLKPEAPSETPEDAEEETPIELTDGQKKALLDHNFTFDMSENTWSRVSQQIVTVAKVAERDHLHCIFRHRREDGSSLQIGFGCFEKALESDQTFLETLHKLGQIEREANAHMEKIQKASGRPSKPPAAVN